MKTLKKFEGGLKAVQVDKPVVLADAKGMVVGFYKNLDSASRKVRKLRVATAKKSVKVGS